MDTLIDYIKSKSKSKSVIIKNYDEYKNAKKTEKDTILIIPKSESTKSYFDQLEEKNKILKDNNILLIGNNSFSVCFKIGNFFEKYHQNCVDIILDKSENSKCKICFQDIKIIVTCTHCSYYACQTCMLDIYKKNGECPICKRTYILK